jgi:hypothetical protein
VKNDLPQTLICCAFSYLLSNHHHEHSAQLENQVHMEQIHAPQIQGALLRYQIYASRNALFLLVWSEACGCLTGGLVVGPQFQDPNY